MPRVRPGVLLLLATAIIGLAGCGVETAATAAAGGASKAEQARAAKQRVADVRARLATSAKSAARRQD